MTAAPWLSNGRLAVLGTGSAVPDTPVTSAALIEQMVARFGWTSARAATALAKRMAINTRHFARPFHEAMESARPGQSNSALAAQAARNALKMAGLGVDDIGYLITHTATPDMVLPSNAGFVADHLGYAGPYVELRQACTGFANALMIAFGLLAQPGAKPLVVVGSDTGSLIFDPRWAAVDHSHLVNLMQMGDGAAAVILAPPDQGRAHIHSAWFGTIGLGRAPGLCILSGQPAAIEHNFTDIATNGRFLFDADRAAAARHGVDLADADILIPHQTSGRIGHQVAAHYGLPPDRFFVNADRFGNTGSAAIWLALADLCAGGMPSGSRVVALGAEATKYMYGGFVYDHR